MNTKELLKAICDKCKEDDVKVTRGQVKAVLEALREVAIDTCKKGEGIQLRSFLSVKGVETKARKLPNGTITTPRLKIKVEASKTLQDNFKQDVTKEK